MTTDIHLCVFDQRGVAKGVTMHPPGPKSGVPFSEQLLAFRRTPDNFLHLARHYGDIVHFKIGPQRFFLLNHPDYVKDVLVTHHNKFLRGWGPQRGHSLFGEGLLTSEGDHHRRHRRLMQPTFHNQRLAAYAEMMVAQGIAMDQSWKHHQTLDIERQMRRLTLAVVCKALFGAEVEAQIDEVAEALTVLMRRSGSVMFPYATQLKKLWLMRKDAQLESARERLDRTIEQIIRERRQHHSERADLLSMLLLMRDEETGGTALSDKEVRDEVMTFFLAGHETMAVTLSWMWYLLSQHPEAEASLHRELDDLLVGGRAPTFEDQTRLRYTEMVIAETLRLYPAQWMLGRRAISDYQVDGYAVPAGSIVLICPYVIHHDPRYFPDPFRFEPQRFTEESQKARPQYSFFPFGAGPRRCIGEGFAWLEAKLLVATLARHWRMRLTPQQRVKIQPLLILRSKKGIRMTLERR